MTSSASCCGSHGGEQPGKVTDKVQLSGSTDVQLHWQLGMQVKLGPDSSTKQPCLSLGSSNTA